jgi:hypothetical protein
VISRALPEDQELYFTERYNLGDFTYQLPVFPDGDYTLVLKFAEAYFRAANQKVCPLARGSVGPLSKPRSLTCPSGA